MRESEGGKGGGIQGGRRKGAAVVGRGEGAGEERVGRDGSGGGGGGERHRGGRGKAAPLSAATILLICYLFLHLPHLNGGKGTNKNKIR